MLILFLVIAFPKTRGNLSDRREQSSGCKPDFPRLADETKERGKPKVEGREVGVRFARNEAGRRWIKVG